MRNCLDLAKLSLLNDIGFQKNVLLIGNNTDKEAINIIGNAESIFLYVKEIEKRAEVHRSVGDSRAVFLREPSKTENIGDIVSFECESFCSYADEVIPYINNKTAVIIPFYAVTDEVLQKMMTIGEQYQYTQVYNFCKKGNFGKLEKSNKGVSVGGIGVACFSNERLALSANYTCVASNAEIRMARNVKELKAKLADKQRELDSVIYENSEMHSSPYQLMGPLRVIKNVVINKMNDKSFTRLVLKLLKAIREKGFIEAIKKAVKYISSKNRAHTAEGGFVFRKTEYADYSSDYQDNIDFSDKTTDVKMIAFYLPQYHTFKENDEWWGRGFTEWTNTKACTPRFKGHYQPRTPHEDIGYYDLSNIETMRLQARLAKQHGIYGFCFYYYWFSGKRLMEKPVDMLLEHPEIDLPFCLCWANENWTRAWDGQNRDVLIFQKYSKSDDYQFMRDIKKYIDDKRYIRINGKPVLVVYNPGQIPNCQRSFRIWRETAVELGIGDILIWTCQTANNTATSLNISDFIDAEVEFPPHNTWNNEFAITNMDLRGQSATIINYQKMVDGFVQKFVRGDDNRDIQKPIHRSCMMAWDNAARRKNNWFTYHCFSLKSLYEWVLLICEQARRDFKPEERFVFINAWNEWAEGTYLEPDERYGYANINTVSKALMNIPFEDDVLFLDKNSDETVSLGKKRIAIQIHMFYLDTMDEIIECVNKIPFDFDCFVSTDTSEKSTIIKRTFENSCRCKNLFVEVFENRGRDVAPFIIQLSSRIDYYDYICHIHSKRTVSSEYGDDWRKYMLKHLLGSSEYLKRLFALFESDDNLGIVFPETFPPLMYQAEWGGNLCGTQNMLLRLGVERPLPEDPVFPVGNMFWARTEAVRGLFKAGISLEEFPEEKGQLNLTIAHYIERCWTYLAADYGFKSLKVMNNCVDERVPRKNRIVFYAHFDKENHLSDNDYITLKFYSKFFNRIVFVSNSDIDDNDISRVGQFSKEIYIRENNGYDFGAWKYGLEKVGYDNLKAYDEVILANNSTYAPVYDMLPMFAEMDKRAVDFWGVTVFPFCADGSYVGGNAILEHVQSYFLVFTETVIKSGEIKKFFDSIPDLSSFIDAIRYGEIEFTQHMKNAGFTYSPYIKESGYLCKYLESYSLLYTNPTSFLLLGSPFIKKKSSGYMTPIEKQRLNYLISKICKNGHARP